MRDNRHLQLKALAGLALLPAAALLQWEQRVQDLVTCVGCTPPDLRNRVACPHCGYSASSAAKLPTLSALEQLEKLDRILDALYTQWISTLHGELNKPAAQETIRLLPDATRAAKCSSKAVHFQPKSRTICGCHRKRPARGLEKVTFEGADLLLALTRPGMPCTPQELEARSAFLRGQVNETPADRVRIQIDW